LTFHQGDGKLGGSWAGDERDLAQGDLVHLRVGVKEFFSVASLEQKLIVEGAGRFRSVGKQGLLGACKASVNGLWREVSLQVGDRVRWFLFSQEGRKARKFVQ